MKDLSSKGMLLFGFVMVFVLFSGCRPRSALFDPYGPTVSLELKRGIHIPEIDFRNRFGSRLSHELLSIEEEGLLILAKDKVVLVEYKALHIYRYNQGGPVVHKKDSSEDIRDKIMKMDNKRLPLLVRFPQGVSPDLMEKLLLAYRQDALVVVESGG